MSTTAALKIKERFAFVPRKMFRPFWRPFLFLSLYMARVKDNFELKRSIHLVKLVFKFRKNKVPLRK